MAKPRKPRKPGKKIVKKRVRVSLRNKAGATARGRRMAAVLGPTPGYDDYKTVERVVDVPGSAAAKERAAKKATRSGGAGKANTKTVTKARQAAAKRAASKPTKAKATTTKAKPTRDANLTRTARAAARKDTTSRLPKSSTRRLSDMTGDEFDAHYRATIAAAREGDPAAAREAARLRRWGRDNDRLNADGTPKQQQRRAAERDAKADAARRDREQQQTTRANERANERDARRAEQTRAADARRREQEQAQQARANDTQDPNGDDTPMMDAADRNADVYRADTADTPTGGTADDAARRADIRNLSDEELADRYERTRAEVEQYGEPPSYATVDDAEDRYWSEQELLELGAELDARRNPEENPFTAAEADIDATGVDMPDNIRGREQEWLATLDDDALEEVLRTAKPELADMADEEMERRRPWREGGVLQRMLPHMSMTDIRREQARLLGKGNGVDKHEIYRMAAEAGNHRYTRMIPDETFDGWLRGLAQDNLGAGDPEGAKAKQEIEAFLSSGVDTIGSPIMMQTMDAETRAMATRIGFIPNRANFARIMRGETPRPYNGEETIRRQYGARKRRTKDEVLRDRLAAEAKRAAAATKAMERKQQQLRARAVKAETDWELSVTDAENALQAAQAAADAARRADMDAKTLGDDNRQHGMSDAAIEANARLAEAADNLEIAREVERIRRERETGEATPDTRAADALNAEMADLDRAAAINAREADNAEVRHAADASDRADLSAAELADGEELTGNGNIRRGNALMFRNRDGSWSIKPLDGERADRGKGFKADTLDEARRIADRVGTGEVPKRRTADNAGEARTDAPADAPETPDSPDIDKIAKALDDALADDLTANGYRDHDKHNGLLGSVAYAEGSYRTLTNNPDLREKYDALKAKVDDARARHDEARQRRVEIHREFKNVGHDETGDLPDLSRFSDNDVEQFAENGPESLRGAARRILDERKGDTPDTPEPDAPAGDKHITDALNAAEVKPAHERYNHLTDTELADAYTAAKAHSLFTAIGGERGTLESEMKRRQRRPIEGVTTDDKGRRHLTLDDHDQATAAGIIYDRLVDSDNYGPNAGGDTITVDDGNGHALRFGTLTNSTYSAMPENGKEGVMVTGDNRDRDVKNIATALRRAGFPSKAALAKRRKETAAEKPKAAGADTPDARPADTPDAPADAARRAMLDGYRQIPENIGDSKAMDKTLDDLVDTADALRNNGDRETAFQIMNTVEMIDGLQDGETVKLDADGVPFIERKGHRIVPNGDGPQRYKVDGEGRNMFAADARAAIDKKAGGRAPKKATAKKATPAKKATAHKKGEPFEQHHLADGETIADTGAIQRGDHTIISGDRGYQVMQQYDNHRIMKPVKTLAAARKQADRMQAARDKKQAELRESAATRKATADAPASTNSARERGLGLEGMGGRATNKRHTPGTPFKREQVMNHEEMGGDLGDRTIATGVGRGITITSNPDTKNYTVAREIKLGEGVVVPVSEDVKTLPQARKLADKWDSLTGRQDMRRKALHDYNNALPEQIRLEGNQEKVIPGGIKTADGDKITVDKSGNVTLTRASGEKSDHMSIADARAALASDADRPSAAVSKMAAPGETLNGPAAPKADADDLMRLPQRERDIAVYNEIRGESYRTSEVSDMTGLTRAQARDTLRRLEADGLVFRSDDNDDQGPGARRTVSGERTSMDDLVWTDAYRDDEAAVADAVNAYDPKKGARKPAKKATPAKKAAPRREKATVDAEKQAKAADAAEKHAKAEKDHADAVAKVERAMSANTGDRIDAETETAAINAAKAFIRERNAKARQLRAEIAADPDKDTPEARKAIADAEKATKGAKIGNIGSKEFNAVKADIIADARKAEQAADDRRRRAKTAAKMEAERAEANKPRANLNGEPLEDTRLAHILRIGQKPDLATTKAERDKTVAALKRVHDANKGKGNGSVANAARRVLIEDYGVRYDPEAKTSTPDAKPLPDNIASARRVATRRRRAALKERDTRDLLDQFHNRKGELGNGEYDDDRPTAADIKRELRSRGNYVTADGFVTTPEDYDRATKKADAPDARDNNEGVFIPVNATTISYNGENIDVPAGESDKYISVLNARNGKAPLDPAPDMEPQPDGTVKLRNVGDALGLNVPRIPEGESREDNPDFDIPGTHRNGEYIGANDYRALSMVEASIDDKGNIIVDPSSVKRAPITADEAAETIGAYIDRHGGMDKVMGDAVTGFHRPGTQIDPSTLDGYGIPADAITPDGNNGLNIEGGRWNISETPDGYRISGEGIRDGAVGSSDEKLARVLSNLSTAYRRGKDNDSLNAHQAEADAYQEVHDGLRATVMDMRTAIERGDADHEAVADAGVRMALSAIMAHEKSADLAQARGQYRPDTPENINQMRALVEQARVGGVDTAAMRADIERMVGDRLTAATPDTATPDARVSRMAEPGSVITPEGVEATPDIKQQIRDIVSPGGKVNVARRKAERESELGVRHADLAKRLQAHPENDDMPPSSRSVEWHKLNADLAESELARAERSLEQFEQDIADFKSRGATDKQLAPLTKRAKATQARIDKARKKAQEARKKANDKEAEQKLSADAKKPADLTPDAPGGNTWEVPKRDHYPIESTKIGPDNKSPDEVAQWLADFAIGFKADRKSDESVSIQFQDAMVNAWNAEGNTADVDFYLGMFARGTDVQDAEFMVGTPDVAAIDAEKLARTRSAKSARKIIDEGIAEENRRFGVRLAREIMADENRNDPRELSFVVFALTDGNVRDKYGRVPKNADAEEARLAANAAERLHRVDPERMGYGFDGVAQAFREVADQVDPDGATPRAETLDPRSSERITRESTRAELGVDGDLVIEHTPEGGTLIHGTSRGDGTAEVLKANGWRWSRNLGAWYVPRSRDQQADSNKIDRTATALEADGHKVGTDIDDTIRSAAEREAAKAQRADDRAEALANKASRKRAAADTAWQKDKEATDRVPPMGEPIKVGHHSERGHRRAIERAWQTLDNAMGAERDAKEADRRAAVAARANDARNDPVTVANRIDRLEADIRRMERARVTGPELDTARDDLAYWRGVHEQHIADGKIASQNPDDYKPGMFLVQGNRLYRIAKVNKKTLSVETEGPTEGKPGVSKIGLNKIRGRQVTPEEAEAILRERVADMSDDDLRNQIGYNRSVHSYGVRDAMKAELARREGTEPPTPEMPLTPPAPGEYEKHHRGRILKRHVKVDESETYDKGKIKRGDFTIGNSQSGYTVTDASGNSFPGEPGERFDIDVARERVDALQADRDLLGRDSEVLGMSDTRLARLAENGSGDRRRDAQELLAARNELAEERARNFDEYVDEAEQARRAAAASGFAPPGAYIGPDGIVPPGHKWGTL